MELVRVHLCFEVFVFASNLVTSSVTMNSSSHSTTSLSGATGSVSSSKTSSDAKFVSFAFVPAKTRDAGANLFTPRDVIIAPSTGRVAGDVTHFGAAARCDQPSQRTHHMSVLQTSVGDSDVMTSSSRRRSDVSFGRLSLTSSQAESARTLTPLSGSLRLPDARVSVVTPRVERRTPVTSPRRNVQ